MTNLLIELQTEELPPKALQKLSAAFAEGLTRALGDAHFLAADSRTTAYGAPRRLGVHITDVLPKSPEEAFEKKLVPARIGLTESGEATPALSKKMASLGISCPVSELKCVNDGKQDHRRRSGD